MKLLVLCGLLLLFVSGRRAFADDDVLVVDPSTTVTVGPDFEGVGELLGTVNASDLRPPSAEPKALPDNTPRLPPEFEQPQAGME